MILETQELQFHLQLIHLNLFQLQDPVLQLFLHRIYDPDNKYEIKDGHYGLANVAPTIVTMMGLETPDCWQPSMI